MRYFLNSFILVIALLFIFLAGGAFYIVDETQQVVLTQFGELIGAPITKAGLYFKIPFVQTANYFDKRILEWDGDPNQIPTLEKRYIWVDATARWQIVDPLKFMQSVRTESNAQARLGDIIDASTREVISNNNLIEAVRDSNRLVENFEKAAVAQDNSDFGKTIPAKIKLGREHLSKKIYERAAEFIGNYGIKLIDVKIKRINYVQEVQRKVFDRMISERKRAAEQYRSEGQGKKAEIEGQMLKELESIRSQAYRTAQEIKGKADAEAVTIYAEAYNQDPEFFAFVRSLESYRKATNKDTTLILSTDNEFYQYLERTVADMRGNQ